MGYALHRVTKELLSSVNTPSFPAIDWIVAMKNEPNVATIESLVGGGVPTKYWMFPADVIAEMAPAEKAVVDAADLPVVKTRLVADLFVKTQSYIATRYSADVQKQIGAIFDAGEKFPNRRAYIQKLLDWRASIYKEQQSASDKIDAATTLTEALAAQFDTNQFDATDPLVTVEQALKTPD